MKNVFLILILLVVVFSFVGAIKFEEGSNEITGNSIKFRRYWHLPSSGYSYPRPHYCMDDEKLDYFKKDSILRKGILYVDECSPNGRVVYERYCTNPRGYIRTDAYFCPNGCEDGACK